MGSFLDQSHEMKHLPGDPQSERMLKNILHITTKRHQSDWCGEDEDGMA